MQIGNEDKWVGPASAEDALNNAKLGLAGVASRRMLQLVGHRAGRCGLRLDLSFTTENCPRSLTQTRAGGASSSGQETGEDLGGAVHILDADTRVQHRAQTAVTLP